MLDLWFVRCYHIHMDNKKTPVRPLDTKALALTGTVLIGLDHGAADAKDAMCIVYTALLGLAISTIPACPCKGLFQGMAPQPL